MCGRVGDDLFGAQLEAELASHGVDTALVARATATAPRRRWLIPVAGEDRRFIHTFGANAALAADDVASAALEAAAAVYVGGYLVSLLDQDQLADRFRSRGPAARRSCWTWSRRPAAAVARRRRVLLPDRHFLPNEDEARALTGERDPYRQAGRFLDAGARVVVIKMGARGASSANAAEAFEVPAPHRRGGRALGSRRAFAAGLIVGILEGWSLRAARSFAA